MFAFLYYCQYWIYAKIYVQQGVLSSSVEILDYITKVVIKLFSYIGVVFKTLPNIYDGIFFAKLANRFNQSIKNIIPFSFITR